MILNTEAPLNCLPLPNTVNTFYSIGIDKIQAQLSMVLHLRSPSSFETGSVHLQPHIVLPAWCKVKLNPLQESSFQHSLVLAVVRELFSMPKPCLALLFCQQSFISASREEARRGFLERRQGEEALVKMILWSLICIPALRPLGASDLS